MRSEPPPLSDEADAESDFEQEAARLYRRYRDEFVLPFNLCPWASRALKEGHVSEVVLLCDETCGFHLAERLVEIMAPPHIEVAIVSLPNISLGRIEFDRFSQPLRARLQEVGVAAAAFHPDTLDAVPASPIEAITFIRCTPDPTFQLVRLSALERVRSEGDGGTSFIDPEQLDLSTLGTPKVPLHERVASANFERLTEVGLEEMRALLNDIVADKERSYDALTRQRCPHSEGSDEHRTPAG